MELPGVPPQAIGHYGRMRLNYLREHRPSLYTRLILSGKLYEHLAEIDQTSRHRIEQIISQMAQTESIDERLKANDDSVAVKDIDDWIVSIVKNNNTVLYEGYVNRNEENAVFDCSLNAGSYVLIMQRTPGNHKTRRILIDSTFHF